MKDALSDPFRSLQTWLPLPPIRRQTEENCWLSGIWKGKAGPFVPLFRVLFSCSKRGSIPLKQPFQIKVEPHNNVMYRFLRLPIDRNWKKYQEKGQRFHTHYSVTLWCVTAGCTCSSQTIISTNTTLISFDAAAQKYSGKAGAKQAEIRHNRPPPKKKHKTNNQRYFTC